MTVSIFLGARPKDPILKKITAPEAIDADICRLKQKNQSMSYEVAGKIVAIYPTTQKSATFQTREFAIEKTDDIGGRIITNYVKFQAVQDKTAMLDKVAVGDNVKVHFNLKGTKWMKDGREAYITNLDAWRIESFVPNNGPQPAGHQANTYAAPPQAPADFDPTAMQTGSDGNDGLPF